MNKKTESILVLSALLLTSCIKDELHNTPHPDRGVVGMSVDFPQGTEEEDYTVEVDGIPLDAGAVASTPLTPGEHTVLVHNTPAGFTVTDGIAYVERMDATRAQTDLIDPLPEPLYSGRQTVNVQADDTLHVEVDVLPRTRDLLLDLTVIEGDPDRIATVTGTFSGMAGAYDLRNETLYGEAADTRTAFTRNGNKLTAALRILGTRGEAQVLTLVLTFTDGQTQTVTSYLTEALARFGEDMTRPYTLTGGLRTPIEAGLSATITDWDVVDGGSVDIH